MIERGQKQCVGKDLDVGSPHLDVYCRAYAAGRGNYTSGYYCYQRGGTAAMFGLALSASRGLSGPIYRVDQIPERFHEHYILRGYRQPKSSLAQCLISIFDPTNETLNVWTHFLPTCYFVYLTFQLWGALDFEKDSYTWALVCYLLVCCTFPLASAVAHLFNVMSDTARHVCFFLDYSALSLFSFGVAVAYRAYCFPSSLLLSKAPHLVWYCDNYVNVAAFNAVLSTFLTCETRFLQPSPMHKAMRLGAFAIPYLYDSVPIIYRLLMPPPSSNNLSDQDQGAGISAAGEGYGPPLLLGGDHLHARQFLFTGVAAFLYATHLPERLLPGYFDIVGHSHQLFHVCGILAVLDQMKAILLDFHHRRHFLEGLLKPSLTCDQDSDSPVFTFMNAFKRDAHASMCLTSDAVKVNSVMWDSELWENSLGYLIVIFWVIAVIAAFFTLRLFIQCKK
ncbi:membrane progestin receptor gamma [Plakobranchus ocellatus]|uniref:Membrane progestin receptor gamma n=1 Tax=Plakobranchus ocellatus TaxID=259542 RepID=A0AAV4CHT2_9GAST|nr:membrane progestin receptor gamma [Plakobranchus ocellatus]